MIGDGSSPDCVVIGAGAIGCALALRLAERGLAVTVIDRGPPGGEASGAAAGILAPQVEADGEGPMLELGLASRALHPLLAAELAERSGIEVGYRRSGALLLSDVDGSNAGELELRRAWQVARGLRVELLDANEVRRLEPKLGPSGAALYFPDEAQVEPRRLVRALELAAVRTGVRFQQGHARRVVHAGEAVKAVVLDDGARLATAHAVVAAGSWSSLLEGTGMAPTWVFPVRGQMVELGAHPAPTERVVFAAGGYVVPRGDGRVLVGSTMERVGYRKEVTALGIGALCELARRVVPSLGDAPLLGFWSGLRPAAGDHLPLLGSTPIAGLHLATGHHRNGILLTPVTAELVAAAVCGERPRIHLAPFSIARFS